MSRDMDQMRELGLNAKFFTVGKFFQYDLEEKNCEPCCQEQMENYDDEDIDIGDMGESHSIDLFLKENRDRLIDKLFKKIEVLDTKNILHNLYEKKIDMTDLLILADVLEETYEKHCFSYVRRFAYKVYRL